MDILKERTGLKKAAYLAGYIVAAAVTLAAAASIILLPFLIHSHIR